MGYHHACRLSCAVRKPLMADIAEVSHADPSEAVHRGLPGLTPRRAGGPGQGDEGDPDAGLHQVQRALRGPPRQCAFPAAALSHLQRPFIVELHLSQRLHVTLVVKLFNPGLCCCGTS